ncbi:MAG: SMP-30/gluconolactonase/LRE family protein [Chelatococcus sp.]|uniref:SMP-30/gluconolactonase/LRE family protein n=1 Tax=Chelatococcus sp. TaxID=1953771 RepID=UPI0025C6EC8F|nr:SMP-30/gluconolactonase/LRE family protein [Chelatococcus sp.]MBX3539435.1 SMP-30/gluconolactonase/LRE family protein [Chelatococcus sp.]
MSLYPTPSPIETTLFVDVVAQLGLKPRSSAWLIASGLGEAHSFLEGPSFDADGNLYVVDTPFGRILRVSPGGEVAIAAQYDGAPNGLKVHRDGDIYVADRMNGIMHLDPVSGRVSAYLGRERLEPGFRGPNDLVFARNGDLYFTDQGNTGLQDPTGRVFRLRRDGRLDCLLDNVPSPNGIALNPAEDQLFVAVTFAQQVWRCPLLADGSTHKVGVYQSFSGGFSGPDGLAVDVEGGLAVCHNRMGIVWMFDGLGIPTYRINSCRGRLTTNLAYGGADRRTLFITESETGSILKAQVPVPGLDLRAAAVPPIQIR